MKLYEEFKEYENMWDTLLEWKAMSTNTTNSNTNTVSSNTSSTTSSSQATNNNTSTAISSKQEIRGCDLDDLIDHMSNHNRLPRLPWYWFIDDIDDSTTDSRIMFSHRKLPLGVQIWAKYYYEDGNWSNCYYEFSWEVSIDGNTWEHSTETFRPAPEDLVECFFEIVNEFDTIYQESSNNGFKDLKQKLTAAGYKPA